MASPAAVLDILLTANSAPATATLAKTQTQLKATGATATKTNAVMKKAFLGIGLAAGAAGAALFKVGEEFDDAFDKISTRTGATGKEMRKLKGVFRDVVSDVPASFDDASTAVGDLNTRLGLSGKPLAKMSKQVTELSRITGTDVEGNVRAVSRAFVDWEVKTKDQSKTLDGFFRLSQKSGIAVSDIAESVQQFGSPLRQLGFSLDEAAAMFASFERAGVNTQTMVPGLKLAIANLTQPTDDLSKSMKQLGIVSGDPEKGLRQVFDLLTEQGIPAAEKTGLAMDVFGRRAGADMAEAVRQGRFELDKFMKTMGRGDTIREAGKRTMDLSEQWTMFKNNLKLAVEPVARDVFKGLSDLMRDVTKAFKKDGLQGVIDLLVDKLNEAMPKIAEAGKDIAVALVKGFFNAPILAQLAVGGWLLSKLGGSKAFSALGTKTGQWFALAFIAAWEAKKIGEIISGEVLDDTDRALKAADLEKIGYTAVQNVGKGMLSAFDPQGRFTIFRQKNGEWIQKVIKDFDDWKQIPIKAGRNGADTFKNWETWLGRIVSKGQGDAKKFSDQVGGHFNKVAQDADTFSAKAWAKWNTFDSKLTGPGIDKVRNWRDSLRDLFGAVPDMSDKNSGDAWQYWKGFGDHLNSDEGKGKASKFASAVARSFGSLATASTRALAHLASETQKSLDSLGASKSNIYVAQPFKGGSAADTVKAQRGAIIVPGTGTGDKVPALLEPGEVVLNRKAVAAMGGAGRANAINSMIPRFASGGVVFPHRDYPMLSGDTDMNPALGTRLSQMAQAAHKAIYVTSGGRTTAEQVALQGGPNPAAAPGSSHHEFVNGAIAADINPGYGTFGSMASKFGMVFNLLGIGEPWHIELASGVSGAVSAMVDNIKRVLLKGPDGPLKDMGQAALDKVRSAANAYINKQVPATPTGGSGGAAGIAGAAGSGAELMKNISAKRGWSFPDWWELDRRETGHGADLYNERSRASLRAQFLPMNFGLYGPGSDPAQNPSMDEQIKSMALYIADRYGNSSAALAWHNAHNWYQRGGIVQKFASGGIAGKTSAIAKAGRAYTGPWMNTLHPTTVKPPKNKPPTYTPTPVVTTPAMTAYASLPVNVSNMLGWFSAVVDVLDEQLANAQILAGFTTSEMGVDLGATEKATQIDLNTKLLDALQQYAGWLKTGISTTHLDPTVKGDLQTTLNTIQGITGQGGRILTVKQALDQLNAIDTSGIDYATLFALSQQQHIEDVQRLAVSQAQYGVFAGTPQVVGAGFASGGVATAPAPQVNVNISDTGAGWLKNLIRAEVEDVTRNQAKGGARPGARGF